MSENGEIYTAGKNFTLPPAVTALTNSTSVPPHTYCDEDNLDYNDYDDSLDAPLMRMSMICK